MDSIGTDGAVNLREIIFDWRRPWSDDRTDQDDTPSDNARPVKLYQLGVRFALCCLRRHLRDLFSYIDLPCFSVSMHPDSHVTRCKVISLQPRFVLFNSTGQVLLWRQRGTRTKSQLAHGAHVPVHRFDADKENRLCLRFQPYGWKVRLHHL